MPLDALEVRISLQKLLIVLVVILVPLNFIGLYLSSESSTSLKRTIGAHFKTIAQAEGAAVLHFVNNRVIDVGAIAMESTVVDAVVKANRAYTNMSDEKIGARIGKVENEWATPKADSLAKAMLSSDTSTALRRHRELDPWLLKIIVADINGVPVAATVKPLHYAPVDRKFLDGVSAGGRGGVYVTELLYDEQSKSDYVGVGFPVLDRGSHRFIGMVNALVDVSSLFSGLNREESGRTARTTLIKEDGTVVSAPSVTPSMRLKSDEYAAVRDALGTLQGREAGFVTANLRGENRIVGFADTGLKQTYPNLGWFVMVSQSEDEALASIRTVGHFAFLMVLVGLLMVTLLAVHFFLHRRQQMADIEAVSDNGAGKERAA